MTEHDSVFVLAASYPTEEAAVADYEAVKALYYAVETSHDFDAAVVAKDADGKVRIVKKHEQPTRHGAAKGLGWGLAAGAVAALFPPIGIGAALAWGGGAGAAIGAVSGHIADGMSRDDVKQLGEVLDNGTAGLVVVYAYDMADQVAANIKAVNRYVSAQVDLSADQLAADIKAAESGAMTAAAPEKPAD
jgi:uncharacterized membrane protein